MEGGRQVDQRTAEIWLDSDDVSFIPKVEVKAPPTSAASATEDTISTHIKSGPDIGHALKPFTLNNLSSFLRKSYLHALFTLIYEDYDKYNLVVGM